MPNFSTAQKVLQTLRVGDETAFVRGENRVKINNAANCVPPLDTDLAAKLGVRINVNWGELMQLLAHACRQYLSAFITNQNFFKVSLPLAPSDKQTEWGAFITDRINKPMRESMDWFHVHLNRWKSVVCHGLGPMEWCDPDSWCPEYLSIEDFRVPVDTPISFRNMGWYATRKLYTPFELLEDASKKKPYKGWNEKAIYGILKNYKNVNYNYPSNNYDWENSPEKLAELIRQDGGHCSSDAMPKVPLWKFYFEDFDDEGNIQWYCRIVPDTAAVIGGGSPESQDQFLWESDRPVANTWKHLIHCQFGDLANKTPLMVDSIRSLGYALLEPCHYTNLTRCRVLQHLHDNFNVWIQLTDPASGTMRPYVQELGNYSVLKQGVNIVPQQMRHQIDANLMEAVMSDLKQLQGEFSSVYTQQIDTGTKKEQTAFETSVKVQQVNAMLSGLLIQAFKYEGAAHREICRRFCRRNSKDPEVQKFQEVCKKAGIPRQWLDVDLWEVEPVTPLGMGNPTVALAEAKQLIEIRPMLAPQAQQEALHDALVAMVGARRASRWAPISGQIGLTNGQRDAQSVFGTLMQGIPLPPREEFSPIEQLDQIIAMTGSEIQTLEMTQQVATAKDARGLAAVFQYAQALLQRVSADESNKSKARLYAKTLGDLGNRAKALIQRGQQQSQQNGNGANGEAQAKLQATMQQGQVKNSLAIQKSQLDAGLKVKAFQAEQKRESERFVREQRREDANAFATIQRDRAKSRMKGFEE